MTDLKTTFHFPFGMDSEIPVTIEGTFYPGDPGTWEFAYQDGCFPELKLEGISFLNRRWHWNEFTSLPEELILACENELQAEFERTHSEIDEHAYQ